MRNLSLPSGRSEFAGFDAFYRAEIEPYLLAREADRRAAVLNFALIVGSLSVLAAAVIAFGPFGEANLHVAAFLGAGAFLVGAALLDRARRDIAAGLLGMIASRLSFEYVQAPGRPSAYAALRAARLLPEHDVERWEDSVRGVHAGAAFAVCEGHLQKRSSGKNRSLRTVFHGQVFEIDYPKGFLGRTIVMRDLGPLNALARPGREFSRVGLASPQFERAFEAWSTDQVEARDLLDPLVLERFQELERLFKAKRLRAAFEGGRLLIAIETGDRLGIGTLFRPLADPQRVETILKEFDVIFDLVDVSVRPVDRPIGGAFSVAAVKPADGDGLSARG